MPTSDKRVRLIRAADDLVYQQGFRQTTLADIAKRARVPLGNVYYYFKTKEEIGKALIGQRAHFYEALRRDWERDPDPKARLGAFIDMTLQRAETLVESGCPIGSLCQELSKDATQLARIASTLFDQFLNWLEVQFRLLGKGKESGDLAVHLISALQGAALLSHSFGRTDYIKREAARLKQWVRNL